MSKKKYLNMSVLDATKERLHFIFDNFEKIYISFSGGKDSTVMLHLTMDECKKRNRKIGLLFIDWEAQYKYTIEHIENCLGMYKKYLDIYWIALPLKTTNSVSQFEPEWICWEKGKENIWVRDLPCESINDYNSLPFYNYAMTFEEFVPAFGKWYGNNKNTACLIGIRAGESLHRYTTVITERHDGSMNNKQTFRGKNYTTHIIDLTYNCYPIYDWQTKDIWIYNSKYKKSYNKLYDRMYQAGVGIHQQRICEPYGDEQKRGLWLFHVIEPETWGRIVSRVNGANSGALYSNEIGNVSGNRKITKPSNHTWESFVRFLLDSMPPPAREHYENKILVYLSWCNNNSVQLPDYQKGDTGSHDVPSWRRICKCILKNDYWCKTLSFSPTKNSAYDRYRRLMRRRKQQWKYQKIMKMYNI